MTDSTRDIREERRSDTPSYTDGQPCKNTDKHLWPIPNDDYYAPSVHATEDGRIGMNVGGLVFVKSIREWHSLASGERVVPKGAEVWTFEQLEDLLIRAEKDPENKLSVRELIAQARGKGE